MGLKEVKVFYCQRCIYEKGVLFREVSLSSYYGGSTLVGTTVLVCAVERLKYSRFIRVLSDH